MRKAIRNKVYSLLKGETLFEDLVFKSRSVPFNDDEEEIRKGVILIYFEKEQSTVFNAAPIIYKRTLDLSIAILKTLEPEDLESIEDQLETVSLQVEEILSNDDTLGGLVNGVTFNNYEFLDDTSSQYKQGAIKLSYSIEYYLEVGLKESDLDDFGTSSIEVDMSGNKDFSFDVIHQVIPEPPTEEENEGDPIENFN